MLAESHNGNGRRVLVVDDEESITELVAMALRYEGFTVETAGAGYPALQRLEDFRPDLLVLDVMLPDVDGFSIAERVRRERRDVPVLFLTARDATEDKVRGLTIGGDDYVTKPFSVAELVARVHAVLRRTGRGETSHKVMLGDLEMDDDAHEVRRAGQLVDLTARNNLLYYRDLKVGTLALGDVSADLLTGLLAGRTIVLSSMFPDADAKAAAVRRARAVRNRAQEHFEERGLETLFLACGVGTWTNQRRTAVPAAPVLLVPARLAPRGAAQDEFAGVRSEVGEVRRLRRFANRRAAC